MSEFDLNFSPTPGGLRVPQLGAASGRSRTQAALAGLQQPQADLNQAAVFYSPTKKSYVVGGQEISSRDENGLLNATRSADLNQVYDPPQGDYRAVDTQGFLGFIDKIANPDLGRRLTKNFESATAGMGELAGAGMSFLGAEGPGRELMGISQRRMTELSPYEMGLEDIDGSKSRGVLDWFAAMVGQVGPSIVETAVTSAIGAVAGAAAGGGPNPVSAAGGFLLGTFGKEKVKQELLKAATKHLAGETLDAAEAKLLREGASITAAAAEKNPAVMTAFGDALTPQAGMLATPQQLAGLAAKEEAAQLPAALSRNATDILKRGKSQSVYGGATLATAGNSYAMGVSDVYREGINSGAPSRDAATLLGIPYAAMDLLPEYLLAKRVFGNIGANSAKKLADMHGVRAKAGELLKRGAKGFAIGGALEGATEAGQEALLIAANPLVDFNSPEAMSRLINSFAAGAAIGGPIGSLANLADNENPTNLLNPTATTQPGGEPFVPLPREYPALPGPQGRPQLPPPAQNAQPTPGPTDAPYAEFTEVGAQPQIGQQPLGVGGAANPILQITQQRAERMPGVAPAPMPGLPQLPGPTPAPEAPRADGSAITMGGPTYNIPSPFRQRFGAPTPPTAAPNLGQSPAPVAPAPVAAPPSPVEKLKVKKTTKNLKAKPVEAQVEALAQASGRVELVPVEPGQHEIVGQMNGLLQWVNELPQEQYDRLIAKYGDAKAIQRKIMAGPTMEARPIGDIQAELEQAAGTPEPTPPKPTKAAAPKKSLKTEAKAKPAPKVAIKGERLKPEKMRAGSRGADAASQTAAPESSRAESPAPPKKPAKPVKAKGATGQDEEALAADLQDAIDEVDAGGIHELHDVHYFAYPDKDENIDPRLTQQAREYLSRTTFSKAQQAVLDTLLSKSKEIPAKPKVSETVSTQRQTALEKLMAHLDTLVRDPSILQDRAQRTAASLRAATLYREAVSITPGGERAVREAPFNGKTVGDYFEVERSGRVINAKLNIQENVEDDTYALADSTDAKDGNFFRTDGTGAVGNIPLGKIRVVIGSVLSALHIKPKVHVYANIRDLYSRNRTLFNRAKAARAAGDFETTEAAGYSFADEVIIFADFIRTEQQLRLVLAHEAIGHFGLRAVVPGVKLNSLLDEIYASDRRVRAYADRLIEHGMDKREAVEEFLADYAAQLETSLVARIWAAIKTALNKLGIHLDDDMSRSVLAQSRLYARTGTGGFFSAHTLMENMNFLQKEAHSGRFERAMAASTLGEQFAQMSELGYNVLQPHEDPREYFKERGFVKWAGAGSEGIQRALGRALESVQTLNNKATRSAGLAEIFKLFQDQSRRARQLLSRYNHMLRETFVVGTKDHHKKLAGKLMAHGALYKNSQMHTVDLDALGQLIKTGMLGEDPKLDDAVREKIEKMGMLTPQEFINGFEYPDGNGGVRTFTLAAHGLTAEDLKPDGKVWKIYVEHRKAVVQAAIDLVLANYEATAYETNEEIGRLFKLTTAKSLERADREMMTDIIVKYREIGLSGGKVEGATFIPTAESQKEAEKFLELVTRAFDNDAVYQSWLGNNADVIEVNRVPDEFRTKYKAFLPAIKALHDKGYKRDTHFAIQQIIRNLSMLQSKAQDDERLAKRTVVSGYVPFKRRGLMQVRLAAFAVNDEGKVTSERVRLGDAMRGALPYFRGDSDDVLNQYVEGLAQTFHDKTFKLPDRDGNLVEVALVPEKAEARQNPDFDSSINMNEFVFMLQRFSIDIHPSTRTEIVRAMTAQNDRARSNLMRTGSPGWDTDVVRNSAEYLEMMANTSAKRLYRSRVDRVLTDDRLWTGNRRQLDDWKQAYEEETNPLMKRRLKAKYENYAYMYRHMAPTGQTVEVNGKKLPTLGQGRRYHDDAKELLHWYSDTTNIYDATEDKLQGELASRLKTAVVFSQLGGTVASAIVNTVSLLTHTIPQAAFYNPEFGSGGGYGWGKAARQVYLAMKDSNNYKLGDVDNLKAITNPAEYNLTQDELDFLIEQTETGALQAVLPDALLGTARGKITDPRMQKAAQLWMGAFSYTEKLNRRVTALAVYRLEKERSEAELGLKPGDAGYSKVLDSAVRAALTAVNETQGEYAQFNRPKMARGNVLSYVFMYKMFPIITVQLLRRMPMKGKLTILAMMLLMSGLKGLPFADDIMDLLDTLLQKLGIKIGSVEAELYELSDSLLPGSGSWLMRGTLDRLTGATISSRVGMGDLIPLTGAAKAGADPWRETLNFAGPMAGGLQGYINSFGAVAQMGVDTLGGRPSSTSIIDIMRQSPIALARALGDTLVYADTGAVVNSSGRVVASDAGPMTLLFRALGFYPAEATRANDLVRVSKASRDYQLEVGKAFKDAYVKAALGGDRAAMRAIEQQVEEWNADAKGTGLEIKTFRDSVQRAIKEAKLPAGERFLKTTPLAMRDRTAEWMRLYDVSD